MNFFRRELLTLALAAGLVGSLRAQQVFPSPADATNALVTAVQRQDRPALNTIFGSEATNLVTGDRALDDRHLHSFGTKLAEGCALVTTEPDQMELQVGGDKWPFPIPLVKTNGGWIFDTLAGEEEIINRHIGRDEYFAIGVCRAFVKAEQEYAERFGSFADRFKSTPGKTDGLYWPEQTGNGKSPLSSFVAEASLRGYDWKHGHGPRPFHGYLFKILTRQGPAAPGGKMDYIQNGKMTGGCAMVAYPLRFGESGVMTFIVSRNGVVYQKCLGDRTSRVASSMKEYNPDRQWQPVQIEGIADLTPDVPQDGAR